jgi:hypothetical protein
VAGTCQDSLSGRLNSSTYLQHFHSGCMTCSPMSLRAGDAASTAPSWLPDIPISQHACAGMGGSYPLTATPPHMPPTGFSVVFVRKILPPARSLALPPACRSSMHSSSRSYQLSPLLTCVALYTDCTIDLPALLLLDLHSSMADTLGCTATCTCHCRQRLVSTYAIMCCMLVHAAAGPGRTAAQALQPTCEREHTDSHACEA